MPIIQNDYQSYLLRVWRTGEIDQPQYRATLEDVRSGDRVGFATLEEMVEYLRVRNSLKQGLAKGPECPEEE